jgi:ABC-type multidrug transport system fused ATPase/permease subunit
MAGPERAAGSLGAAAAEAVARVNWRRVLPWFVGLLVAVVVASVVWNVLLLRKGGGGGGPSEQSSTGGAPAWPEYVIDIARRFAREYWPYYALQLLLILVTVPVATIAVSRVSADFTEAQSKAGLSWNGRLGAWHVLIGVLLFSFGMRIVRAYFRESIIPHATSLISAQLFDRYLRNYEAAGTESDEGVGDVLYALRQVTEDTTWLVVVWLTDVMTIVVMLGVLSLYLGTVSRKLGLMGLAFSLVILATGALYNVRIVQKVTAFQDAERRIMGRGEQYVVNAAMITAFNGRGDVGPDLQDYTDQLVEMRNDFTATETGYNVVWRVLMLVFFAGVTFWCLRAGRQGGGSAAGGPPRLSRSRMQTLLTVLFLLMYWLMDLSADMVDMTWRFASVTSPYATRLFNLSAAAKQEQAREAAAGAPRSQEQPREEATAANKLEVRAMGFRYPASLPAEGEAEQEEGRAAEDGDGDAAWTISPFTLVAAPGERLVVKGKSGSGKSTLMKLLAAFETPTTGEIRLGGAASHEMARSEWRRRVLFVSQKWSLFSGSVLRNMVAASGVRADPGLRAEDMTAFLRHFGLDAVIPDVTADTGHSAATGGGQMSGGMGKLIVLVRAMLRAMDDAALRRFFPGAERTHPRPKLVLFDEPLAALDEATRAKVIRMFGELLTAPTITVYIMHNDDMDAQASRVLQLAGGVVSEEASKK